MANITPIAKTRQLTASLPAVRPTSLSQRTPAPATTNIPARPMPDIATPTVARQLIDSAPVPVSASRSTSYKTPETTQSVTTPTPMPIIAERQAAAAILTPTYSETVMQTPYPSQTVSPAPERSLIPSTTRQETNISDTIPLVPSMPSSDVSTPILPATRKYQPSVTPVSQPISSSSRAFVPSYVQPAPSSPLPSASQGSGTSTIQGGSQPSSMPSMLSTPLLSSPTPGLVTPGVYAPDQMHVHGSREHYWGDDGRAGTNVIVPQVSMPTQITQGSQAPYQVPYTSSGQLMPLTSGPGVVQPQYATEAPLDTAYKAVKVLAIAGIGIGALYWIVGKLAPKVEFKR